MQMYRRHISIAFRTDSRMNSVPQGTHRVCVAVKSTTEPDVATLLPIEPLGEAVQVLRHFFQLQADG